MLRQLNEFLISLLLSGIILCLLGAFYFKAIRPRLIEHGVIDGHEYERWLEWCRNRWDIFFVVASQFVLVFWNTALDLIVEGANLFDGLKGNVDLTAAWIPEWLQQTMQFLVVLLPILRTYILLRQPRG